MILRSVIKHVREQNWVAVGLDFVIVVVGVFIGIQVANWNQQQRDRESEGLYLVRLGQELSEISALVDADYKTQRARLERLEQLRRFFATGDGISQLGGHHCAALSQSHIFADTIFYPATIKELIATGRIVLIRDDAVRTAILSFDQNNERLLQMRTDIQIDRLLLARNYPQFIVSGLGEWEDAACDFEAMMRDQGFLNDFIDNFRRFEAYVYDVTGSQSNVLESMRLMIASSLGDEAGTPETESRAP